jgi:hypothetical protein
MRTTLQPAVLFQHFFLSFAAVNPHIPFLSMVIFSAELVFGPVSHSVVSFTVSQLSWCSWTLTNCANDTGSAVVLLGLVVDVEVALPFQLGAVGEVVESVTHLV